MQCTPLVSVVIPTYNRATQTIAAITSALTQTYPRLEVIVVNDGSTDGSADIIERFLKQRTTQDRRLLYLSQANSGQSSARNAGIVQATGDYIAFLDSDDIWLNQKLERQVCAMQRFDSVCGGCFTDVRMMNKAGMDLSSFRLHGRQYDHALGIDGEIMMLLARAFSGFWISSLLVRADLVRAVGGLDPNIRFAEDWDFHFRLSLLTRFAYVNEQLVESDRTPSPAGSDCRPWDLLELQFLGQESMFRKWLTRETLPPEVLCAVKRSLGSLYSHWTNWHLETGNYEAARASVTKALSFNRTPGIAVKWVLAWFLPALAQKLAPRTRPIGTLGHAS